MCNKGLDINSLKTTINQIDRVINSDGYQLNQLITLYKSARDKNKFVLSMIYLLIEQKKMIGLNKEVDTQFNSYSDN